MDLPKILMRSGWIFFGIMWVPFFTMFIGMIGMPSGSYEFSEVPALTRYSLIAVGVFGGGAFLFIFGGMFWQIFRASRVMKGGKQAPAEILDTWDTGTTVNNNPLMGFELLVQPKDYPEFTARTEKLVSRLRVHDYRAGKMLKVKYDPETEEVAII